MKQESDSFQFENTTEWGECRSWSHPSDYGL